MTQMHVTFFFVLNHFLKFFISQFCRKSSFFFGFKEFTVFLKIRTLGKLCHVISRYNAVTLKRNLISVQKFPIFLKQFKLLAWQLFRFAGLLYQTIFKQCSISIPFENFRFFYVFRGFRCGRLIKNGFTSSKKKENKPKKINSSRASRIIIQLLQISQNYVEIQLLQSISKCEMQSKLQAVTPNNAIETHDSWVFSLKIVSKRFIRNIKVTSWQPNIFFYPVEKFIADFVRWQTVCFL